MDLRAAEGDDDDEQAPFGGGRALQERGRDVGEAEAEGPFIGGEVPELARDYGAGSAGDLRVGRSVWQRDQRGEIGRARVAGAGEIGLTPFEEGFVDREELLFRGRGRVHARRIDRLTCELPFVGDFGLCYRWTMSLESGRMVTANVRLARLLRRGGMGSVWCAEHLSLGTDVAVKFMSPQYVESDDLVARFTREATSAAQIKSPHVVQILDHGVLPEGLPFIVMELLLGEDLAQRIKRLGPLPLAAVATVVLQVGKALSKAHQAGILHRDIKPDNISRHLRPRPRSRSRSMFRQPLPPSPPI